MSHIALMAWFIASTNESFNIEIHKFYLIFICIASSCLISFCIHPVVFKTCCNRGMTCNEVSERLFVSLTDVTSSPCFRSETEMKKLKYFFRSFAVYNVVWRGVTLIAMGLAYGFRVVSLNPVTCSPAWLQEHFDNLCFILVGWGILSGLITEATFALIWCRVKCIVLWILVYEWWNIYFEDVWDVFDWS